MIQLFRKKESTQEKSFNSELAKNKFSRKMIGTFKKLNSWKRKMLTMKKKLTY